MKLGSAAVMAALALGLMAGTAEASPLKFTFVGLSSPEGQQFDIQFKLDSNPVPDASFDDQAFEIENLDYTFSVNKSSPSTLKGDFFFLTQTEGGGFAIQDPAGAPGFIGLFGQQLFTGIVDNPTFKTGSFDLAGGVYDAFGRPIPDIGVQGQLTISAVPLPASAPMFGAAVLALGAVGYGVKRKKAAAAA